VHPFSDLPQIPPLELGVKVFACCLANISIIDTASAVTTRGRVSEEFMSLALE